MSRYRTIHCLIWNDDKFPYLTDNGKLVFFHVLTTPLSTPFGCFKAGVNALAEESRIDPERYQEGFTELLAEGLIEYDKKALVLLLPCFLKYNKPANPNVVTSWGKVFSEIPASPQKDKLYRTLELICIDLGKGFPKRLAEWFCKPPLNGMPNQEQEQDQTTPGQDEESNIEATPFD